MTAWPVWVILRRRTGGPGEARVMNPRRTTEPPRLVAVVHTEEEFDWNAPFARDAVATTHARHLDRGQALFARHGIKPIYAVGYPIARDPTAVAILRGYRAAGAATIGAHLHPWVTPPFDEPLGPATSYPGNLPAATERAKLETLTETIAEAFGERPRIYLAGRYGIGPNTAAILESLDYRVDLSPSPPFDFRAQGGPDFRDYGLAPRRLGRILQVPHSAAHVGWLADWAGARALWAREDRLGRTVRRLTGRTGLLSRVRLSPEGADLRALRGLVDTLLRQAVDPLVLSFHSPSLAAGFTPYVRTEADLQRFLATIDDFLGWFRQERGGVGIDAEREWRLDGTKAGGRTSGDR
jgi:hypothetical protein